MRKPTSSKLDPYLDRLEHWLGVEQLTLDETRQRLRAVGCSISMAALSRWWRNRRQQHLQNALVTQIADAAHQCQQVEAEFSRHPAPPLETLVKLHHVIILKLSAQANVVPTFLSLITDLMKPVMQWARLEEKKKLREFAQKKYRDQLHAQGAASADAAGKNALTDDTLEKIERELHLF